FKGRHYPDIVGDTLRICHRFGTLPFCEHVLAVHEIERKIEGAKVPEEGSCQAWVYCLLVDGFLAQSRHKRAAVCDHRILNAEEFYVFHNCSEHPPRSYRKPEVVPSAEIGYLQGRIELSFPRTKKGAVQIAGYEG